jgi:hypothetical protein
MRIFIEYELSKLPIDGKYELCKWTGLEWQEHEKKYAATFVTFEKKNIY